MVSVGDKVFVAPLYNQKDNLAVITGPAGAAGPGGIIEGDYNTWTKKWLWALPTEYYSSYYIAFCMDEVNDIFYLWWDAKTPHKIRFGSYNIVDHTAIFESPTDSDYTLYRPYTSGLGDYTFFLGCHGMHESIHRSHQTYMLLARPDYFTIEVWKAGSLLWTRDVRDDTGEVWAQPEIAEISLTGKYIMLLEKETKKLLLYEGSKV